MIEVLLGASAGGVAAGACWLWAKHLAPVGPRDARHEAWAASGPVLAAFRAESEVAAVGLEDALRGAMPRRVGNPCGGWPHAHYGLVVEVEREGCVVRVRARRAAPMRGESTLPSLPALLWRHADRAELWLAGCLHEGAHTHRADRSRVSWITRGSGLVPVLGRVAWV